MPKNFVVKMSYTSNDYLLQDYLCINSARIRFSCSNLLWMLLREEMHGLHKLPCHSQRKSRGCHESSANAIYKDIQLTIMTVHINANKNTCCLFLQTSVPASSCVILQLKVRSASVPSTETLRSAGVCLLSSGLV